MKMSLKWLGEYVEIADYATKSNDLAALLTAGGIEVEGIENRAKDFENVVIGHILKKDPHPNADRLTLCQVATGEGVVHQIVCGARNHHAGDRVVVALPGAVLPARGDAPALVIKRSQIRGVDSGGMLCSEKELGLKDESEGILLLPETASIGQSFAKYMGFDDIIFELKVTPNRADCLSHFGLAREIGALLGREVKFPIESVIEDGGSTREMITQLSLAQADMCPRYAGRGVVGVKVAASPRWLQVRLEAVGLKPINNVVDVTNFVMMELGQPLHAFDVREIKGRTIKVARATAGEKFTTLDGTEVTFDGTELTIRDGERAVALAGVVGGKNSGILDDTTDVFIEAAYFAPAAVRRTARKFNIETDSSYRFARGTNPDAVPLALNRATQLIQKVAGGKIMGEAYDIYPSPLNREAIEISSQVVEDRMGYKIDPARFVHWMKRLGCVLEPLTEAGSAVQAWRVKPPLFRWDLTVDMDLVEEYARLEGYQHIPETLPALVAMPLAHDQVYVMETKLRRLLQAEGCQQAVNYAFISSVWQGRVLGAPARVEACGLRTATEPVKLVNPLNEDLDVMRTALVPGLIKTVLHNTRFGNPHGRIYELGKSHFSEGNGAERIYREEGRLAFALWGRTPSLWAKGEAAPLVFTLKGVIENCLRGLAIDRFRIVPFSASDALVKEAPEFLHPGQSAYLEFQGQPVGFVGAIHPSLTDEYKIREDVVIAEFNLDRLLVGQPKYNKYRPISKMPATERDLAFLMPKTLTVESVEKEIRKAGGELLRSVQVFDVFQGGQLPETMRSVAFRLVFQAQEATLQDQRINEIRDIVVNAVSQKLGISLR